MISCIICSRNSDISLDLKKNINCSIGCDYELIVIDNSRGNHSIFSAYNKGLLLAKGNVLCFFHEDIIFRCDNWGNIILDSFNQNINVGCVGVWGYQFLSEVEAPPWMSSPMVMGDFIQGGINNLGNYETIIEKASIEKLTEVVALDGLFLAIKKETFTFNRIKWDDITYNGFHMYDLDICVQLLLLGYRNYVSPDILIEHKSYGNISGSYYKALSQFYAKWKHELPLERGINVAPNDMRWRTYLLTELKAYREMEKQYNTISNSRAYRFGKYLIKPFKLFRNKNE